MEGKLYIAVEKKTGEVLCGAKGQYAFADKSTLKRSVAHVSSKDLYEVYSINLADLVDYRLLNRED